MFILRLLAVQFLNQSKERTRNFNFDLWDIKMYFVPYRGVF